jgi:flagellar hook-basal body complex protein FliE
MKYFSDKLNKVFEKEDDLHKAEEDYDNRMAKAKADQEKLKNERSERAKEVEKAMEDAQIASAKATELLNKFIKDYGAYHTTLTVAPEDVFDEFFKYFLNW